jgi:hypothetical protein
MCTWVGNQWSYGVVTTWVQTDVVRSLHHQHRDLHQLTYPIPLGRSGLILLSGVVIEGLQDSVTLVDGWSRPGNDRWKTAPVAARGEEGGVGRP